MNHNPIDCEEIYRRVVRLKKDPNTTEGDWVNGRAFVETLYGNDGVFYFDTLRQLNDAFRRTGVTS